MLMTMEHVDTSTAMRLFKSSIAKIDHTFNSWGISANADAL